MAIGLGVRLIGVVENMSYIICSQCGEKINLFGASHAEYTARRIGTRMLGQIPLDPQFSTLCDQGAIETYHSREFKEIMERVVELVQIRKPEVPSQQERV